MKRSAHSTSGNGDHHHHPKKHNCSGHGFDIEKIKKHIHHLLINVQLCFDGPDLLNKDSRKVPFLLEQRYAMKKEVAEKVRVLCEDAMHSYRLKLFELYEKIPARDDNELCDKVDEFADFLHTSRKMQKLMAKSIHLKEGSNVLTTPQKDFLLQNVDKVAEEMKRQVEHACGATPRSAATKPHLPQFYPLVNDACIEKLFKDIVDVAKLGTADQVDLYMILCRQMVLFVPTLKHAKLEDDIVSTFEIDEVFRFKTGTYNIKNVFSKEFCKKCCEQIDIVGERQSGGVVHFVSGKNDIPSRRVWDLLENDSSTGNDGVFRVQVRNPVIVAINACTLGTDWRIGSLAINETIPGSVGQEAHIDYTKWRKYGPFYCEFPRGEGGLETESLQGTVVFEPFTVETGGTGIIPGSHLWEAYPLEKNLY